VSDARGYYALLGLAPTATAAEIKAAFYAKAKELHPDRGEPGDSTAFQEIREAYRILGNRHLRANYDRWEGQTLEWIAQPDHRASSEPPPSPWRWAIGVVLLIALAAVLVIAHFWIEDRHSPPPAAKYDSSEPSGPPPLSPADAEADAAVAETLAAPTAPQR
jgi:curved DNA-binding protein CbpA